MPVVRALLHQSLLRAAWGSFTPRRAHHPSSGLPCSVAVTIALATALAGGAVHHGGTKEQSHLTAVFFQWSSVSVEQRGSGSVELPSEGGHTWEHYVWGARSEEMQISLVL